MKTMEEHTTGNEWGVIGGVILGLGGYLINIDWTLFFEQLGTESIKVAILGALGGAAGLLGKKMFEQLFFKKKKK